MAIPSNKYKICILYTLDSGEYGLLCQNYLFGQ